MNQTSLKKCLSLGIVMAGVLIEHLDIMLVNLFAVSMIGHFFRIENSNQQLILGFMGYGISFVFRPLGAAVFGVLGDLLGRKSSMLLSVGVMSLATLGIGTTPSYERIGIFSSGLFVLFRIFQGMSVGGEYGSAMTYSYEISRQKKTAAGALVVSATHMGGLVASLLATKYAQNFQISFCIAGVVGLASLGLRSLLLETSPEHRPNRSFRSLFIALRSYRSSFQKAFLIGASLVFVFYTIIVYFNEVIFQRGLASREDIYLSNAGLLLLWIILPTTLGYAVDHFSLNYKRVMQVGSVSVTLLTFPLFIYISSKNSWNSFVLVQYFLSVLHGMFCFATPRYLGELFEFELRSTGVSLGYAIGASFTAAITPLACHALVLKTGSLVAIGIPLCLFTSSVSYVLSQELKNQIE